MADDEDTVVPDAEEGDRTVVVERGDGDGDGDKTVVVARRPRTPQPPVPLGADDPDEDRTVVVERDDDRTVVVERKGRGKRSSDATTDRAGAAPAADPVITLLPARRGITTAPVDPAALRAPVEAVGPNVVETYVPRQIAPPPAAAPGVPRGEEALRAPAPSMPSVARSSRTAGAVALLAFAGACLVSVVGVIAVVVWFVRS
ncbi:MAG: hypothetical protein BGO97_08505 [Micrococcales bacterium 70-64]|nr:hypothetical protein [Leifsonia sp.]ODU64069.1 MAG: hypothetical protein ABT06_08510 [Leifsonia sp. SCN 70-46]OJX85760.1 MAG: hypothetical protein BGO97_08505 [Micrococcales bacterium 70-64]